MSRRNERISDRVGVIALDACDYDREEHITTVGIDNLTTALEMLDTLGWNAVDIHAVDSSSEKADYPMLLLRTPENPIFDNDNAGISVAPLREQGREELSGDPE